MFYYDWASVFFLSLSDFMELFFDIDNKLEIVSYTLNYLFFIFSDKTYKSYVFLYKTLCVLVVLITNEELYFSLFHILFTVFYFKIEKNNIIMSDIMTRYIFLIYFNNFALKRKCDYLVIIIIIHNILDHLRI